MRGSLEKSGVLRKFELKFREHVRENVIIFAKIKTFLTFTRKSSKNISSKIKAFSFQLCLSHSN
jgi:hypothetical protein